jgi:hypothetical protein
MKQIQIKPSIDLTPFFGSLKSHFHPFEISDAVETAVKETILL